jgi:hypothetical protein
LGSFQKSLVSFRKNCFVQKSLGLSNEAGPGVALEMTRVSLGLVDTFADGIIAKRIIELGKAGERNPDILCEGALKALRGQLFGD